MIEVKEGLATLDLTKKSPADVYEFLQALLSARYKLNLKGFSVTVKKSYVTQKSRRKSHLG